MNLGAPASLPASRSNGAHAGRDAGALRKVHGKFTESMHTPGRRPALPFPLARLHRRA